MQAIEKTIKLDPKFKYEVSEKPGGESVRHCFQCGKCEATCPIARFKEQYRPAQVIRAIMLGCREFALGSPTIWLCATCYSCSERCPQGVRFTDIMRVIRNMAVAEGKVNPFYKKTAEAIIQFGRTFDSPDFINEMRCDLGLPPVTSLDRQEIAKIIGELKVNRSKESLNK
ncbi:MAG: 4Fe-4S dicluster domain-containing protein [Candidatus Bathyarchaeia archaeon]|jgi:heterodisulfide reductase subunit C